jgi:hypothetical protein
MAVVPRFAELLAVLHDHGVEFIIVGGVAAVLEGAPVSTFDLDIVPRWSPENLDRLAAALVAVEALYRGRDIRPTRERLESPGHHLLDTSLGALDVLGTVSPRRRFEDLERSTVEYEVGDRRYRVLDLATQIDVKRHIGREKDRAVLPTLERTLERKRTTET